MRKLFIASTVVLLVLVLLYAFRMPILRAGSTMLMHEDKLEQADAMFILSGGGYDRGNEAVKLFRNGYSRQLVCTGGNPVVELKIFNMDTLESDMTIANLKRQAVADSNIVQIKYGTSTREEADTIIRYCKTHQLKKIILLSSRLHTGRVNYVFRQPFKNADVELIIHGAPSSRFNEYTWWKDEEGLIAVNNEWIKTIYYWFKY
ncbi:MAG: YdcF family protein [Bacteroidetes bacterium]|nr:YdcF family protein [Bacteroidota bacterium]